MPRLLAPLLLALVALSACSKTSAGDAPVAGDGGAVAPVAVAVVDASAPPVGNAAAGMTKKTDLLALAKPGAACAACFFNGRCALLTTGDAKLPCCDYTNGTKPADWTRKGAETGHAAECLALALDAPHAPGAAKGSLLPLAKPGAACAACFFNGRCALLTTGDAKLPCCDYTNGTKAGAWKDDPQAPECLALEADIPHR